jgi:hypothetical protein
LLQLVKKADALFHLEEHLFHYTPKTLGMLLQATGFGPIMDRVAEPFFFGRGLNDIGKRLALLSVKTVFRMTGCNFGGILMYARKAKNTSPDGTSKARISIRTHGNEVVT